MLRSLPILLFLAILSATRADAATPAAPATRPAPPPQASVRPESWEQDNERLKAQITRLTATAAELEKRPAPATRPAPAAPAATTLPTSRPVSQLVAENRRLVGSVNALLDRIRRAEGKPTLSQGVGDISISFACEGHSVDEISELLGMSGQLASEQDGKLQYEWLFKIQEPGGKKIGAIQPWVCEVVDGKIVKNQMLERRQLGGIRREAPKPPPRSPGNPPRH
jgi:hypothetical protein